MKSKAYTYCDICLSACGLEVEIDEGRIVAVRGDEDHPLSKGYLCIRGKNGPASRQGPERLRHPLRRTASGWERISWERAYGEIAGKLGQIRERHGPGAIGMYYGAGNPTSFFNFLFAQGFLASLGSRSFFNVLSIEFTGRFLVFEEMYGHAFLTTAGDFERSSFVLMLGSNPAVSEEDPGKLSAIEKMRQRGGTFVVVDPRRTQTAKKADRWLPIRPGTDVYVLLALNHVVVEEGLFDRGYVERRCVGFEDFRRVVAPWTPARAAKLTGLDERAIGDLARDFARAQAACAVAKLGVYQTRHGTVAFWLVEALNAITGNLERPGGVVFKRGALPLPLLHDIAFRGKKARTRDGLYPEIIGSLPAASIPDEILSPGGDGIRALFVDCGNPLLCLPNEARVREALQSLDLLVSLDVFMNETTRLAHYVLPAAAHFEKEDCYVTFPEHQPRRFIQWAPALVDPPGEAKPEWEVFLTLSRRMRLPLLNTPGLGLLASLLERADRLFGRNGRWRFGPRLYAGLLLRTLSRTKLRSVLESPHGLLLPEGSNPGAHPKRARINLAPAKLVAAASGVAGRQEGGDPAYPLLLITGERERAKVNTRLWYLPLIERLRAQSFARIHPADAARAGVTEGDQVTVSTRTGSVTTRARVADDIREGVVSIPHGWGRSVEGEGRSLRTFGVSPNRLTDDSAREPLTGMPVYNGIPCRIAKA